MSSSLSNVLSVDVEEYFHALNLRAACPESEWESLPSRVWVGVEVLLDLFAKHGVKATFFVLGWVAERYPEIVKTIASQGHEIGSHGVSHKTAFELSQEAMKREIVDSKKLLSELSQQEVQGFRASTFSVKKETSWVLDQLIEAGYRYDSSIFPVRHDRYGIPDFSRSPVEVQRKGGSIVEVPPLTRELMGQNLPAGGGGYLRIFPLSFHLKAIRLANAQGIPAMIYLHPWEFDPDQPRFNVGRFKRFRHYFNLHKTRDRVERYIENFPFVTTSKLLSQMGKLDSYSLA